MKLYYAPGACSLGIHVLMEEIGKPYDTHAVNMKEAEQYSPAYVALNPKSKVPMLQRDDGSVLTEFGAIAAYLARTNPAAKLMPEDAEHEARVLEALDYMVATVHMQGFTRVARPGNFSPNEADHEAVKTRGRELYAKGMALLDAQLAGKEYLVGPFSVADAALFYLSFWSPRVPTELPPNVAAHFARMKQRPAVQRALAAEGLA